MTTYRIKKWPSTFHDLWNGYQIVSIPSGDACYLPGDVLIIDEYIANRPTGRVVYANVQFPMTHDNMVAVKVTDRYEV